jgi:hypothetical protein
MERRSISLVSTLPPVMWIGLLILSAGGTLDLIYHAAPLVWTLELDHYLGAHGAGAHVITLIGMVVTLLGLPVRWRSAPATHEADIASERRSSIE